MHSPYRNRPRPLELPSGIVYFHDWRYVQHGRVGWRAADGSKCPLWTTAELPSLRYEPTFLPVGVQLRAQPAHKCGPVLTSDQVDEHFLSNPTVLEDQGRYRLWFDCTPVEHIDQEGIKPGDFNYLRYAESDDGESWTFPALGLVERHGRNDNNVVYGGPETTPGTGYHGGSVFKDPSAPPESRYKMIHQGHLTEAMQAEYRRARPDAVDALNETRSPWLGLFGATAPDGLHWSALPEPLVAQVSDTHNVCEYDPVLEKYVAYCRNWFFRHRTVGRIIADEFRCRGYLLRSTAPYMLGS